MFCTWLYQSTKLHDANSSFIILANSVTISHLTMKFRKHSTSSSICIFSVFYFPILFFNKMAQIEPIVVLYFKML